MTEQTTVVQGRVAYDVENAEWVIYVEDGFVAAGALYAGINEQLSHQGLPPLKVGDEITVTLRRDRKA